MSQEEARHPDEAVIVLSPPATADASPGVHVRSGLLAPRLVALRPGRVRMALIATTATLLGGDHARLRIRVGRGIGLDLFDVAGTVAYHGRGRGCRWSVDITLDPDARLAWAGEPLVISHGAQVQRDTRITLAAGSRFLMRDTLVLGRTTEVGGDLRCRTRIDHGGVPALVEDLDLRAARDGSSLRDRPGIAHRVRVIDTITAVGWAPAAEPPAAPADRYELALSAGGAMVRRLGEHAHDSSVTHLWHAWRRAALDPSAVPTTTTTTTTAATTAAATN